jgi:ABC-type microcin C transport system duplicated ATPase subunit YejF
MQGIRGNSVSMIFQEPMTSLNPVLPIGDQVDEVIALHTRMDRAAVKKRTLEALEMVGIADPLRAYALFPTSCPAACASG